MVIFSKAQAVTDSAVHYYQKAIGLSYGVGFPYMRQYCFEQLAQVYESEDNLLLALSAQKSFCGA